MAAAKYAGRVSQIADFAESAVGDSATLSTRTDTETKSISKA